MEDAYKWMEVSGVSDIGLTYLLIVSCAPGHDLKECEFVLWRSAKSYYEFANKEHDYEQLVIFNWLF